MSFLNTLSVFYYGFLISKNNQNLDFNEGSGELTALLNVGDYTFEEILVELETALNLAGTLDYTVTGNRTTRVITIAASGTFSLLCATGSHLGTEGYSILGFNIATDKTGAATYNGTAGAGSEYRPQTLLKDYIKPEDWELKESAVVSVSANGQVQTVSFGDGQRMQCNIIAATNLTNLKNQDFYENATGEEELRNFLRYLITKSKIEFMPDVSTRNVFYKLLLESTAADKNGVTYKIQHVDKTMKYYQSGLLTFRKVIE